MSGGAEESDPPPGHGGGVGGDGAAVCGTEAEQREQCSRTELNELRSELSKCQEEHARYRQDMDSKMQDIRQKTKDHLKQAQEKMQTVIKQKDIKLEELQSERAAATSEVCEYEARNCDARSEIAILTVHSGDATSEVTTLEARCQSAMSELSTFESASRDAVAVEQELGRERQCLLELRAEFRASELRDKGREEAEVPQGSGAAAAGGLDGNLADAAQVLATAGEIASQRAATSAMEEELRAATRELDDARASGDALRAEIECSERQVTEVQEEMASARQESEMKVAEVVRKAKEHFKQVQTRLESSATENRELTEKHREVDEAYKQQQEKVLKYKQLMKTANARIEDGDESVRELRETLSRLEAQNATLQEKVGSMDKAYSVPPSREEIARLGGIRVAVETENDDVWCLVCPDDDGGQTAGTAGAAPLLSPRDCGSKSHWWLMSQLDVDEKEKPIPLQRRWKGEVSALRAQMLRFKRKSEELEEEFDAYRQKANAALKTNAANSQESEAMERRLEHIGEQLQAMSLDLQRTQSEKGKALEDLVDTRRRLQEALAQKAELERTLDLRVRELQESQALAVGEVRRTLEAERDLLEQRWREKGRAYQQELDLRKAQKESMDEEIEGLRERLAGYMASVAARIAAGGDTGAGGADPPGEVVGQHWDSDLPLAHAGGCEASDGIAAAAAAAARPSPRSVTSQSPRPDPPPQSLPEERRGGGEVEAVATAGVPPPAPAVDERPQHQVAPPQAYTLQASVAWEDLVMLRSQVRQLEIALEEERQLRNSSRREGDKLTAELNEVKQQQLLQNNVGQHQQMEYIRNVFRKFVESMPCGDPGCEQLIPVLMTFFQFPEEEAKAIQGRRSQGKSVWNRLSTGWAVT